MTREQVARFYYYGLCEGVRMCEGAMYEQQASDSFAKAWERIGEILECVEGAEDELVGKYSSALIVDEHDLSAAQQA